MKFLIVFSLALAIVSAKNLYSRLIEAPVLENEGRIINGKTATLGQLKYQAAIALIIVENIEWCSGSLIGKNWILSAAHCTVAASSGTVFLGTTQYGTAEKNYDFKKGDISTHPNFDPNTHENDISLIRIPTTSESSKIAIVRISSSSNKYVGNVAVVSGWGATSDANKAPAFNLQYVMLKVAPDSLCSQVDRNFNVRTNICVATPNEVSFCNGDTGAPLVLEIQNLQIGLLSFGARGSCAKGSPIVFTSVGSYHSWIKSITGITGQ